MGMIRFCGTFLLVVPLASALAQGPGQAREHHWVNPLPDTAHERLHHDTYRSAIMGVDIGFAVYLPPGYEDPANAGQSYPVVYFLHGGGPGNESRMIDPARVDITDDIHARIQAGVVGPMIYVFANGGTLSHYDHGESLAETTFVEELIPHIDSQYRTIASRAGRGIEGFSSGGRGVARDMFKHPQLFCSAVPLAGGHQHEKVAAENDGHLGGVMAGLVIEPGYNSWDLAAKYAAHSGALGLQILVVVGNEDMNYAANLEWMDHLESLGIEFERQIVPETPHDPEMIYEKVGDEIMSFHQTCFSAEGS